jgi:hypothetical protein
MSLDHETEDSVTVMVTVTDSGGLTAAADDGAIDENAMGAVVGAVTGSDVDDGDTLTYTVDDERFEVAGGMLQLKEGMSLDHETEDSVTVMVTVTDSGGLTAEASATVTVNDVNEGPSVSVDDGAIDENAMGAVVGAVTGSDVDDGDTMTYTVSDERFEVAGGMLKLVLTYTVDDERFEVAGGMLQLKEDGMSLDHETEESVTVTVTVTDSGGLSAEATATVAVSDVNEAPTVTAAGGATDENVAGAMLGAVTGSDVDDGDTLTYTVSDERFEVTADGMLKLVDGMSLDHETEESVTVTVTVTDSGGLSAEATATVAVSDVNEAPTVTAAGGATDENVAGAMLGAVTGSDVDDGDTLTYTVSDERFEVTADGMLKLVDGMSLDHETGRFRHGHGNRYGQRWPYRHRRGDCHGRRCQ